MAGKRTSPGTDARAPRSKRLRGLLSGSDGNDDFETLTERFPRGVRRRLLLCLAGVTLAAVAVRVPFFANGIATPDTGVYLRVGHGLTQGLFPSDLRPPGYSLLLAAFDVLGINEVDGVVGLQNLIGIFLPAWVLLVGWRFFSPPVGVFAGFLTAASPLMLITEQFALADFLFGVGLFTATALLAESVIRLRAGRCSRSLLVTTGVAFGVATLFRANGQLGILVMPAMLLLATRNWRAAVRPAVTAIIGMLLVLVPWVLHNTILYGDVSVATEGGISLYSRAVTGDRVPPPSDSPEGQLALAIYNTAEPGPLIGIESGRPTTALFDALINEGRSESEAAGVMGSLAREAIFEHLDIYLEKTWEILGDNWDLYNPHTPGANATTDQIAATRNYIRYADPALKDAPGDLGFTRALWQTAQTLTWLAFWLTLGGALVLLLPFVGGPRKRLSATTFIVVLALSIVGGSLTGVFSPRYDIMFAAIVWLLLAATVAGVAEVIAAAVRRRVALADG
jgi:hypothetical protein